MGPSFHATGVPQTRATVSIQNVVASASVDQRFDLNAITKNFLDVEYHPSVFPGLVFRLKDPKTATLIFSSGKMVCTGAKSEGLARRAVKDVVRRLREGGVPVKGEAEVTIQNIVASANLGGKIDLEEAARQLPKSMYEPEQFPGIIHRMADPKTVILLFSIREARLHRGEEGGRGLPGRGNLHATLEQKGLMTY